MSRRTLGTILLQLITKGIRLALILAKKRPSLTVSIALHVMLLVALGTAISLPSGKVTNKSFVPVPENLQVKEEPDPLLPPDPTLADDSTSPEDMSEKNTLDNTLNNAPSKTMPEAPNLIVAAGVNSLFQMPSGNGTDLQGTGAGGGGGGGGDKALAKARKRMGKLFGLDVGSGNQGLIVFLDKSGSMEKVAEQVQALVEQEFPDAKVFNLRGALFGSAKSLEKLRTVKKADPYILTYYQSMLNSSIIPKCTDYLQTTKTNPESIYMLSDFADYIDFAALNEFCDMLVARKIKFFAHSLDKSPPYAITRVCQVTGGAVLVLPADKLLKVLNEEPAHK